MAISLRPQHVRRYKDLARLLVKYGRRDVWSDMDTTSVLDLDAGAGRGNGRGGGRDDAVADGERLARDLEALGPTFVKLGQLLSTRADLLPRPYVDALSRLQDDVEPFPSDQVRAIVEEELGFRLSKGFSEFELEPIAAASLGQVHRAAMRDGREVAVKVQRPDIRKQVWDDLAAIGEMATFVDRHSEIGKRFGFADMVREFRRSMLDELDYRREARNLATLADNLAGFTCIHVPRPIDDYTTDRVLTMEYVGGRKITSVGPMRLMEIDGPALARELFSAYLHQVLIDGFFHADPHPGNVFVTDDGRLGLVDVGMVARVSPSMQDDLLRLLVAVSEGRGDDAAEVALNLGSERDDVPFERDEFLRRVSALVAEQSSAAMEDVAAGAMVGQLSRIAGECGLRPAPELTMLGKALLNLDEVARTLDPLFAPDATIREEVSTIVRERVRIGISPGALVQTVLEAKEFAEKLPGRVNKVMDALAEGRVTLHVQGIDEESLMRSLQKVANRVTAGLLLAALIVGAAMMMRVSTSQRLFGYPAIAIVSFLLAATGAVALLATMFWSDRRGR
jgi:ubiquinone biosynthesis protein